MLPLIAGLALVGAGVWIYNELQEQAGAERERWRSKREEVQRSIEWHEAQIRDHLSHVRESYDFKVLVDMHFSCMKVADQAYSLLKDAITSLEKIGEAIAKTKEQRDLLFDKKKASKNKAERDEIQKEISSIQELRSKLFADKDEIKNKETNSYPRLRI
ncbi:MAG TPA: hypothetical protein PKG49_01935 [Nitrosomonas mobilis]|nr:hypothetical protein [Nitrosomonas mobilis]